VSECEHRPVVRRNKGATDEYHYLVCGECGLLLDFRPLEEMGVKADDWRDLPDITEAVLQQREQVGADQAEQVGADQAVHRFRVTGAEEQHEGSNMVHRFDETYEIEGEHPAEALEKLLHEIEWGILDADWPFEIEYLGKADE